jgi:hypothetical protein
MCKEENFNSSRCFSFRLRLLVAVHARCLIEELELSACSVTRVEQELIDNTSPPLRSCSSKLATTTVRVGCAGVLRCIKQLVDTIVNRARVVMYHGPQHAEILSCITKLVATTTVSSAGVHSCITLPAAPPSGKYENDHFCSSRRGSN